MNDVKIKGTVEKIVRAFGQTDAQVTITIPISAASEIPLGAVNVTIQSLQSAMFNKNEPLKLGDKNKGGKGSKK
jgi:hypothetical protein